MLLPNRNHTTMKTKNTNSVSVPFRLDPMSKARMDWIKVHATGIRPSGSMILRRALDHYLKHVETALDSPEEFQLELIRLKACASGDMTPWKSPPDFTQRLGQKFSEWCSRHHQQKLNRMYETTHFEQKAQAVKVHNQ